MLITKQPKKSNNNIRYSLGNNQQINTSITGKPIKKIKTIKQKLHKNLSQLPFGLVNESKQNASLSNLMIPRPHSSLIASDISRSLSREKERVDVNSFCKDKIKLKKIQSKRNTLSIVDVPVKSRKISLASNSTKKWNNKSVEEDPNLLKFMMAENRKKYNLSCGDIIESKSKIKQNTQKLTKKKSIPAPNKSKNQSKKTIVKASGESEVKNFKPAHLASKSKGNTGVVNQTQAASKVKKKEKQNKQNKKKQERSKSKSKSKNKNRKKKSKSNKMFVLFKGDSDEQKSVDPEYPTNKYVDMKKKTKKSLNIRVGLDYNFSCLNLGSNSSGIINEQYSSSIQPNKFSKSNLQGYSEYEASDSINLAEIKHYQQHSPLKTRTPVRLDSHKKMRRQICGQLQEQYPYLNSMQLEFLSSIVLIQRKWREVLLYRRLDQRRLIVTEYLDDQNQKELKQRLRKQKNSSEKNRLGDKMQQLSRTKIGQFQLHQEQKLQTQTQAKSKIQQPPEEEGDQTGKNNSKNQLIIFLNEDSEDQHQQTKHKRDQKSQQPIQQVTDRKPKTQTNTLIVNYAWIATRQVFPEVSYLEYRKNMLRESFQKTMKSISEQKFSHLITEKQFEWRKNNVISSYQKELQELKKAKHDIKKGYLKYIDCINKIKSLKNPNDPTNKIDNKYGLRKVSSDSNFLSTLYEKIFKFDSCLSEWSGGSQSIQMLTKRILIRKQFFRPEKKSQRNSLSEIRSSAKSSYQLIRSSRQYENNTLIIFDHTDRFVNMGSEQISSRELETENGRSKQFKFSNQIFKSKQKSQHAQTERQHKKQTEVQKDKKGRQKQNQKQNSIDDNQNIQKLNYSIGLIKHKQQLVQKIQSEVILELAKQLEKDIHRINPVLMDIILINQPSVSQLEEIDIGDDEEDDFKSPAMHTIQRQLQTMGSPRNLQSNYQTQPLQVMNYIYGLVTYINRKNWARDILFNMNHNQTFQPLAYLKFLRDFQIPEDQYTPIINNERFIEWEAYYSTKMATKKENNKYLQVLNQSQAIFHRCVFEVFLAELQKNRPYGERGRPFPWQQKYSSSTIRQIAEDQFSQVIQKAVNKIEQYLVYRCGLITQKLYIINQEQLERAHEQNEGRIIEMLEQDLAESSHQWYEVEQHLLEIKLELSYTIQQMIFEEITELIGKFIL